MYTCVNRQIIVDQCKGSYILNEFIDNLKSNYINKIMFIIMQYFLVYETFLVCIQDISFHKNLTWYIDI